MTSKITLDTYSILQVPEVWIYDRGELTLYLLQDGDYQVGTSQIFPDLPIPTWVPQLVNDAIATGTRTTLRDLRHRLQNEEGNR